MTILEYSGSKLVKVKIVYHNGMWLLRPHADARGVRGLYASADSFILNGDVPEMVAFLEKINAKDADIAPAGVLKRAYPDLAQDLKDGYSQYIYVYKRDWEKR